MYLFASKLYLKIVLSVKGVVRDSHFSYSPLSSSLTLQRNPPDLGPVHEIFTALTRNDCFSPPLSAIFSPCVIRPFTYSPTSSSLYLEYWSIMHCVLSLNARIVALFHHCIMFPSLSNWRPAEKPSDCTSKLTCGSITHPCRRIRGWFRGRSPPRSRRSSATWGSVCCRTAAGVFRRGRL